MDIKRDWDGIQKDIILLRVFDIELQDELQMNNSHLKFSLQPPLVVQYAIKHSMH